MCQNIPNEDKSEIQGGIPLVRRGRVIVILGKCGASTPSLIKIDPFNSHVLGSVHFSGNSKHHKSRKINSPDNFSVYP